MPTNVLRGPLEGCYFQSNGHWTANAMEALDFERSQRAVHCALSLKLRRFEVLIDVLDHAERSQDFAAVA